MRDTRPSMSLPPRGSILITGAHVLTLDDARTTGRFDIYCEEGEIREVAPRITGRKVDHRIDGSGSIAMPGLVQAHVHLCQTLFRARAEELELLDWLQSADLAAGRGPRRPRDARLGPPGDRRAPARGDDVDPRHGERPPHRRALPGRGGARSALHRRQDADGRGRGPPPDAAASRPRTPSREAWSCASAGMAAPTAGSATPSRPASCCPPARRRSGPVSRKPEDEGPFCTPIPRRAAGRSSWSSPGRA